jgi:hypothetical protein
MQRMRQEFPLEPEQLESVFDTLDNDHNGYLTLEEFTEGSLAFILFLVQAFFTIVKYASIQPLFFSTGNSETVQHFFLKLL